MMIGYHYRVTKYNSALRDSIDTYLGDEWSSRRDIGREIGGHTLTEVEFESTVNRYMDALQAFTDEAGVQNLTVLDLNEWAASEPPWSQLHHGSTITVDKALELAARILRETGPVVRMEDGERFYVHTYPNMYMWIGSEIECPRAAATAGRIGLYVEAGVTSPLLPHPADRFWWLRDGAPVEHILLVMDPSDGRILARRPIPDELVPALREQFTPHPDDPQFYDSYVVDESRRAQVSKILKEPLDPEKEYHLWTRWVRLR